MEWNVVPTPTVFCPKLAEAPGLKAPGKKGKNAQVRNIFAPKIDFLLEDFISRSKNELELPKPQKIVELLSKRCKKNEKH